MYNDSAESFLAQVPLTVSPFVSLPTATTLPYTYKSLPSSLPPSSIADQTGDSTTEKPKFVVSSSGQAAHPDDILASCQRLQSHLDKLRSDAEKNLNQWEKEIEERELAEKRRLAPGWLDRNERILRPAATQTAASIFTPTLEPTRPSQQTGSQTREQESNPEAEALDRAFGSMNRGDAG